jgi:hypothetical protein
VLSVRVLIQVLYDAAKPAAGRCRSVAKMGG